MKTEIDKDNFKKEFKELIKKYDVMIGFECSSDSDLHGVYDEQISVISATNPLENILSVSGYWLSDEDI